VVELFYDAQLTWRPLYNEHNVATQSLGHTWLPSCLCTFLEGFQFRIHR